MVLIKEHPMLFVPCGISLLGWGGPWAPALLSEGGKLLSSGKEKALCACPHWFVSLSSVCIVLCCS